MTSKMRVDFGRLILLDAIIAALGGMLAWACSRDGAPRLAAAVILIVMPVGAVGVLSTRELLRVYWAQKYYAEQERLTAEKAAEFEYSRVGLDDLKRISLFEVKGSNSYRFFIEGRMRNGLARRITAVTLKAMFSNSRGEVIEVASFALNPVNSQNTVAEPGVPFAFKGDIQIGTLPKDFTWQLVVTEAHYVK